MGCVWDESSTRIRSLHRGGLDLEGLDVSLMWFYSFFCFPVLLPGMCWHRYLAIVPVVVLCIASVVASRFLCPGCKKNFGHSHVPSTKAKVSESFLLPWMQKETLDTVTFLEQKQRWANRFFCFECKKIPWTQSRSLSRSKGERIVSFALDAKKTLHTVMFLEQKQRWANRFFCSECKRNLAHSHNSWTKAKGSESFLLSWMQKIPWRQLLCVMFPIQNNGEIEPRGLQQTTWYSFVQIALIINFVSMF